MPDLPLILNTGVEYVVNWLAGMPSPISDSLPSLPSEGGTLSVYEGKRRPSQPGEVLVEMDGLFSYVDRDIPTRIHHQPTRCVIDFKLRPLSPTRAELRAAKAWLPAAEPYLASLLREMVRLWCEPSVPSQPTAGTGTGGSLSAAPLSSPSPCFCVLREVTVARLREVIVELRAQRVKPTQIAVAEELHVNRTTLGRHVQEHLKADWNELRASRG
jgi:hypothetical protein